MSFSDSLDSLRQANAFLGIILDSLNSAVLVQDERQHIAYANASFCTMFGLPGSPDYLIGMKYQELEVLIKRHFANPITFMARVNTILTNNEHVMGAEVVLADGRILVYDHVPILVGDVCKGHLWQYRDVTTQRREQLKLRLYHDHLSNVLMMLPCIIWSINADGIITLSEGRGLHSLGYQTGEMVGKSVFELYASMPQLIDYMRRALKGERLTAVVQLGSVFLESHYDPIWENDEVVGVYGLSLDVSERHHMEHELAESRDRALEASQTKSEFLATMSHEIRTPMNGIIGMSELMLDTPLNGEQREYAEIVHHEANALLGIINDILDFSKIEAGKAILDPVTFSLAENIASVTDLVGADAEAKGLQLDVDVSPEIPALYGDGGRLRQILLNLVNNAIKFTPSGRVEISVKLTEQTVNSLLLTFTVKDTGIGIPQSKLKLLFEPFMQVDGSTRRIYGGTGLGLAIVKRLVKLLNGEISVESAEGVGTSFTFSVPFLPSQAMFSNSKPEPTVLDMRSLLHSAILVVDDDSMNRHVIHDQLQWMGFLNVDFVSNGGEALERVRRAPAQFQLILMDCSMPGMNGFETTRQIRQEQARLTLHTPIIAITARATTEDRERCLAAGMDDFLTKPIMVSELQSVLERWLSGNGANPAEPSAY